jgi:two-component system heavy metal sensor histidine kinase CusS
VTLRRRTFLLVIAAVWGVLVLALGSIDQLVDAALRRQLDGALLAHARTEAASCFDRPGGAAHVHERQIDASSGALTKYAAIYDLGSGALLVKTQTFVQPPPLAAQAQQAAAAGREYFVHLRIQTDERGNFRAARGIYVPAPEPVAPRAVLLLAVPDETVSQVRAQIRSAAVITALLGLLLSFAVAQVLARRLTRGTEAIARAARRVASGDLSVHIDVAIRDQEIIDLEHDLNDMIERLSRLLVAQRRFTSDAAHELRSPLTALRGQIEVALRRPRSADEYHACLTSCLEDVKRLIAVAEDLLALARLEGRPHRGSAQVDLLQVIRETLLQQEVAAQAAGVVLQHREGSALTMQGDALQISRLIRNLLENAIRVSPPAQAIEVAMEELGDKLLLRVLDRGPGVPPELQAQIFEPLMRIDSGRSRAHGGTGLGLSIAREIARVHGGELRYRDRPGGGAIFEAELQRDER